MLSDWVVIVVLARNGIGFFSFNEVDELSIILWAPGGLETAISYCNVRLARIVV